MEAIKEKVRGIINAMSEKNGKAVSDDADLFEEGILDSFNMILLVTSLQSEFAVEISYEDLIPQNLWTIEAITALIGKNLKGF